MEENLYQTQYDVTKKSKIKRFYESNKVKNKLNNNKFFYLKRRLTQEEKTNLWLLGNKAIVFEKKKFRI